MQINNLMPGSHSHLGYSSRLLARCERNKVRTNVDIHTLVQKLQHKVETFSFPLTRDRFTDMSLRATRREQVESVEDETNVPFLLSFLSCLMLSRQECKPGI